MSETPAENEHATSPTSNSTDGHPLDNPVLYSLSGAHHRLAITRGAAMRYPAAVSPFVALPRDATNADWDDLAQLAGDNEVVILDVGTPPPPSWEVLRRLPVLQMTGVDATAQTGSDVDQLGESDALEMLALAERTKPGPFGLRTHELGSYFGIRRDGHLVAMAGERFHPPGWTEVSGVCTDSMFRGEGFAVALMSAVLAGIRERGESPFLHVLEENEHAVGLYLHLGYVVRREVSVIALRPAVREAQRR